MVLMMRVLTPNGVVYNDKIEELVLPTRNGQVGVLPGHAPLITALDINILTFRAQKKLTWNAMVVVAGFALVKRNQVIILVNRARTTDSVDRKGAEEFLKEATNRLNTATEDLNKVEASLSFKKARAIYQICE